MLKGLEHTLGCMYPPIQSLIVKGSLRVDTKSTWIFSFLVFNYLQSSLASLYYTRLTESRNKLSTLNRGLIS